MEVAHAEAEAGRAYFPDRQVPALLSKFTVDGAWLAG